jgi:hypothetical protein
LRNYEWLSGPAQSIETPLRTDYEGRQALVEIEGLLAMELGPTFEELCTSPILTLGLREAFYLKWKSRQESGRTAAEDHCSDIVPARQKLSSTKAKEFRSHNSEILSVVDTANVL